MFSRPFVLALCLTLTSVVAAEPLGKVELSLGQWQETIARLDKAEAANKLIPPQPPTPPLRAIVSNANAEISWVQSRLRITTDLEVEVLHEDWLVLPLADASLPLVSSQTSGGRIVVQDGAYALLINQIGKVKIRLVQEQTQVGDAQDFWFAPATSFLAKLTTADPSLHYTLNAVGLSVEPVAMSVGDPQKMALHLQRSAVAAAPKANAEPGVWQSRSETLVAYEDGQLKYHSRVVLLCASGDDREATLTVPSDAIVLSVESEGLERWERLSDTANSALHLLWKQPGARQRIVILRLALAQPNLLSPWPLQSPQISDQSESEDVWQVNPPPGLRLTIPRDQPLAASLSGWMREQSNGATVFLAKSGSSVAVGLLKMVTLAEAQIESATFSSELAAGGGMLTDARFEIASSGKTTVDFQLQPGTRIISCRVSGKKQLPIDLGEGRIQLEIASLGTERTTVELTYSEQLPAFDPASGQVRLTMPRSQLLTKSGSWSVSLPVGLSLSAFDGSLLAQSAGPKGELRFHQELYRDTAPTVELFYQKKIN